MAEGTEVDCSSSSWWLERWLEGKQQQQQLDQGEAEEGPLDFVAPSEQLDQGATEEEPLALVASSIGSRVSSCSGSWSLSTGSSLGRPTSEEPAKTEPCIPAGSGCIQQQQQQQPPPNTAYRVVDFLVEMHDGKPVLTTKQPMPGQSEQQSKEVCEQGGTPVTMPPTPSVCTSDGAGASIHAAVDAPASQCPATTGELICPSPGTHHCSTGECSVPDADASHSRPNQQEQQRSPLLQGQHVQQCSVEEAQLQRRERAKLQLLRRVVQLRNMQRDRLDQETWQHQFCRKHVEVRRFGDRFKLQALARQCCKCRELRLCELKQHKHWLREAVEDGPAVSKANIRQAAKEAVGYSMRPLRACELPPQVKPELLTFYILQPTPQVMQQQVVRQKSRALEAASWDPEQVELNWEREKQRGGVQYLMYLELVVQGYKAAYLKQMFCS